AIPTAERCRHRCRHHQHLPLRHLFTHPCCHPSGCGADEGLRRGTMDRTLATPALSRRLFIVAGASAAGGLAIGMRPGQALPIAAQPWSPETAELREMNAWLIIEPDDTIIIRYPRSEMGQGSFTALPMIVADELEADWSKVKAEFASANRNLREDFVYGKDMSSVGSHSVRFSREQMQQVGASARMRLVRVAAQHWGVLEAECEARLSKVTHK